MIMRYNEALLACWCNGGNVWSDLVEYDNDEI
jgi:hypothetical protein